MSILLLKKKVTLLFKRVKVAHSCPTPLRPRELYTVHGIPQARILEWVAFLFFRDLPNPGIEPRSPTVQVDSSPAEPQGKPKNTGADSVSLLQGIFPTQESNQGLLYCRLILYQLIKLKLQPTYDHLFLTACL